MAIEAITFASLANGRVNSCPIRWHNRDSALVFLSPGLGMKTAEVAWDDDVPFAQ